MEFASTANDNLMNLNL